MVDKSLVVYFTKGYARWLGLCFKTFKKFDYILYENSNVERTVTNHI